MKHPLPKQKNLTIPCATHQDNQMLRNTSNNFPGKHWLHWVSLPKGRETSALLTLWLEGRPFPKQRYFSGAFAQWIQSISIHQSLPLHPSFLLGTQAWATSKKHPKPK